MTSKASTVSRSIIKCVADLVAEEKQILRDLTLNSIQCERTVELFNKRINILGKERDALNDKMIALRKELEKHTLLAELCTLPPELEAYVASIVPPSVSEALFVGNSPSSVLQALAIPVAEVPKVDHNMFQSCLRYERLLVDANSESFVESNQGRLQQLHTSHESTSCTAYVPVVAKDGSVQRRPATADLAICESSAIGMGRVVVAKRYYASGDLLLLEHPFLTLVTDSSKVVLTKEYATISARMIEQQAVFTSKGWDQRLAVAFVSYICELGQADVVATKLSSAVASLGCPLDAMDADRLGSLCEYAHFIHAALPAALQEQYSEGTIVAFCVTFQTNAIAHGHSNYSADPYVHGATSEQEKHSLFAFGSLLQHSCRPNAILAIRSLTDIEQESGYMLEIRAIRPIRVGEAVSISYCNLLPPTAQRRRTLRARYHFDCMCPRCTREPDSTRCLIDGADESVVAVAEGVRWATTKGTVRADDPSIVNLLKLEGIFVERVNAMDAADVSGWRSLLVAWNTSHEGGGFSRLAPEHFAVVTCACMFAACATAIQVTYADLEILSAYTSALLTRVSSTSASAWLSATTPVERIASFDFSKTVDPFLASTCALPVLEGLAQATKGGASARLWYIAAMILSHNNYVTSDRLLRAKLLALPLIGENH